MGGGRPEMAALAALAAVMTPASGNAARPHFNEAVVVLFASLDADGDANLTEEEWHGFYSAALALSLFNFSPPPGRVDERGWHEQNARRLFAELAGASGMDLSAFGAWCRRHLDREQIFRWYANRT